MKGKTKLKTIASTFADKVIEFNKSLNFKCSLPERIDIMNPFQESEIVIENMTKFYRKFYNDNKPRKFLIGINPGRFGAGVTGVPFTDTKRLQTICDIPMDSKSSHEPSAVFVYKMIEQFGGVAQFYNQIYINSVFPLAIIRRNEKENWVNCNYYDDKMLFQLLEPYMIAYLKQQISFGIDTNRVFVLGKKNMQFLNKINERAHFFNEIVYLEHPRYIQQYKSKEMDRYIEQYITILST